MERLEYAGEIDWGGGLRHELFERLLRFLPYGLGWRLRYLRGHHRWPRLSPPRTYNEKILWRILYDRRPELGIASDKLASKRLVAERAPEVKIPEVYWSGTDLRELAEVELPDHWVLKPNNTSGLLHFGSGTPSAPEAAELARATRGWIDRPFEPGVSFAWEWGYSQAERCFLVEERIGGGSEEPRVLKVITFDGEPAVLSLVTGMLGEICVDRFAPDGQPLEFDLSRYGPSSEPGSLPESAGMMIEAASAVGTLLECLSVDFHVLADGSFAFAELTAYPSGGVLRMSPRSFDFELGGRWSLPDRRQVTSAG